MNAEKAILLIMACAALCSCSRSTKTAYEDDKVKVLLKDTVNFVNVHASHDEMWLIAFGKTYKEVRGQEPYYLELPERDSILFVTGRSYDNGQATVHIVNLKTKEEVNFPAYDSGIGDNIIAKSKRSEKRFEEIESLSGDKLVIKAGFGDRRFRYFIDLARLDFEKEEASYPSGSGTNFYILPHGRESEQQGGQTWNFPPISKP